MAPPLPSGKELPLPIGKEGRARAPIGDVRMPRIDDVECPGEVAGAVTLWTIGL